MKSILCFVSLFSLVTAVVLGPDYEKQLVSFVEASMKCHHIAGMTLAIVKGNETWSRGFGMEDFSANKMVDSDSRFGIGSVTKAFTATLLGMLLSEKRLDWTAKVTDILGAEYGFVDQYRTKELMLRDLLSHRTGLAGLDAGGLGSNIPKSISRGTFSKRMKYLPEEVPIRDGFIYNNYMFMMLGHVCEVLGNDTWENLVTKRIFEPLGMSDTFILKDTSDLIRPHVARPYIYKDDGFVNGTQSLYIIYPSEPAGSIMSTATDMTKWITFNLKLGETESGKRLIDKKMMADMRRLTSPVDDPRLTLTKPVYPVDNVMYGYGYAWYISEYRGFQVVSHSGALNSYRTLLWTLPDKDIGLFASVNGIDTTDQMSAYHHRVNTFYYITDYLLGMTAWLNETTTCSFPEPWANKTQPKPQEKETPFQLGDVTEYEGSYGNAIFPDLLVNFSAGNLYLHSNQAGGILHQSSEKDRFLFEVTYPLEFAQGNATQLLNATFQRDGSTGGIDALMFQLEVNFTYFKRGSLLNPFPIIIG